MQVRFSELKTILIEVETNIMSQPFLMTNGVSEGIKVCIKFKSTDDKRKFRKYSTV